MTPSNTRLGQLMAWGKTWIPLGGFVGGFAFDSLTLGREVKWYDLLILTGYAVVASVVMVVNGRSLFERARPFLVFGAQFALGAMFSALVVLYFKSAGGLAPTLFVLGLFAAMVANEFLHHRDHLRELVWAVFLLSIVMWLNFLLPHLLKTVQPAWFYVSTALGVAMVVGLNRAAGEPRRTMRAPLVAVGVLVALHVAELIPPVPLVLERGTACTTFEKDGKNYTCWVEPQSAMARFLGKAQRVTHKPDEPVYVLSAVSAPGEALVVLEHRWFEQVDGAWVARDVMAFEAVGGRKDGWRFWSRKRRVTPGLWRVQTALQGGGVLGQQDFEVVEGQTTKVLYRL